MLFVYDTSSIHDLISRGCKDLATVYNSNAIVDAAIDICQCDELFTTMRLNETPIHDSIGSTFLYLITGELLEPTEEDNLLAKYFFTTIVPKTRDLIETHLGITRLRIVENEVAKKHKFLLLRNN